MFSFHTKFSSNCGTDFTQRIFLLQNMEAKCHQKNKLNKLTDPKGKLGTKQMMKKVFLEHSATLMKSKQTRILSSRSAPTIVLMLRKKILCRLQDSLKNKIQFSLLIWNPMNFPNCCSIKEDKTTKGQDKLLPLSAKQQPSVTHFCYSQLFAQEKEKRKRSHKTYNLRYFLNTLSKQLKQNIKIKINEESQ